MQRSCSWPAFCAGWETTYRQAAPCSCVVASVFPRSVRSFGSRPTSFPLPLSLCPCLCLSLVLPHPVTFFFKLRGGVWACSLSTRLSLFFRVDFSRRSPGMSESGIVTKKSFRFRRRRQPPKIHEGSLDLLRGFTSATYLVYLYELYVWDVHKVCLTPRGTTILIQHAPDVTTQRC